MTSEDGGVVQGQFIAYGAGALLLSALAAFILLCFDSKKLSMRQRLTLRSSTPGKSSARSVSFASPRSGSQHALHGEDMPAESPAVHRTSGIDETAIEAGSTAKSSGGEQGAAAPAFVAPSSAASDGTTTSDADPSAGAADTDPTETSAGAAETLEKGSPAAAAAAVAASSNAGGAEDAGLQLINGSAKVVNPKIVPSKLRLAKSTSHPGGRGDYEEVSGLQLDIHVASPDTQADTLTSSSKPISFRRAIPKVQTSLRGSRKKEKRASLASSTLTLEDKGNYASVSTMLSGELGSVQGEDEPSPHSLSTTKEHRSSLRSKRLPSETLPSAPKTPATLPVTCDSSSSAYACVSPMPSTTLSKDETFLPASDAGSAGGSSRRGSCTSHHSPLTQRKSSAADDMAGGCEPLVDAYASVSAMVRSNGSSSVLTNGIEDSRVGSNSGGDDHYASVMAVNGGETRKDKKEVASRPVVVARKQKSLSLGAYARVTVDAGLPDGGAFAASSYAVPKKLSASVDQGDGFALSQSSTYTQPLKKELSNSVSTPVGDAPDAGPHSAPDGLLPFVSEDPYAVPSPHDHNKSTASASKGDAEKESPYAHPVLPEKTADAMSLLSADDLLRAPKTESEEDR